MNKFRFTINALAIAIFTFAFASMAQAQATRTWVSGVGDDVNPCSRTAPCKTFQGAISKTAAGGEIDALDPGGFGTVTITKAITIDGRGAFGSIVASGTNGIAVNAGANDVVVLRGLSLNGVATGLDGVRFVTGAALHVEDCIIQGFSGLGINFAPTAAASRVFVKNTVLNNNAGGGMLVSGGTAVLEKSAFY